jgi:general stress protein 26
MTTNRFDNEHLYSVLKHFRTTMLVSSFPAQAAHARPMTIAELGEDLHIYLVAGADSAKMAEVEQNPRVTLVFQDSHRFATLSGSAQLKRDPQLIDRLWSEAWQAWFPKGKSDPEICLIYLKPEQGEYWDSAGVRGVKYLFEAARAYVTGARPATDSEQHARGPLP